MGQKISPILWSPKPKLAPKWTEKHLFCVWISKFLCAVHKKHSFIHKHKTHVPNTPTLGLFLSIFWSTKVISSRFKVFLSQKSWFCLKKQWLSVKKSAADAALTLKSTGTGLGTENATATVYHPEVSNDDKLSELSELQLINLFWWGVMLELYGEKSVNC